MTISITNKQDLEDTKVYKNVDMIMISSGLIRFNMSTGIGHDYCVYKSADYYFTMLEVDDGE